MGEEQRGTQLNEPTARTRQRWDRMSAGYDRRGDRAERWLIGDTREWLCQQASGKTLEVAVGTGRNLDLYPPGVELVGLDLSPGMLAQARSRADRLHRPVELREGDAQRLPFEDASFDTVVCTLALCAIPDQRAAIAEMHRVLRPRGRVLLVDHIEYTRAPFRWVEPLRARRRGTSPRRRPLDIVREGGFAVDRHDRMVLGLFDRVVAHRAG